MIRSPGAIRWVDRGSRGEHRLRQPLAPPVQFLFFLGRLHEVEIKCRIPCERCEDAIRHFLNITNQAFFACARKIFCETYEKIFAEIDLGKIW